MIARPFGLAMIGGARAFRPLQSLIMTLMIICHKNKDATLLINDTDTALVGRSHH